jgi:hypothetical protein
VVDFDASAGILYEPLQTGFRSRDPFSGVSDDQILRNPHFHAQNTYAIAMCTLARFEFALGRRLSWSFRAPVLKIAPHAFADANAFYSKRDEGMLFGYFPSQSQPNDIIYTCLSHDIVAHETTHALLDGLRERYIYPSSPQQAGFHEGFADVVALLSVFSLRTIVEAIIDAGPSKILSIGQDNTIDLKAVTPEKLHESMLFGVAEQLGSEIEAEQRRALPGRSNRALRRSVLLKPSEKYLSSEEFQEPHRCGELLVASMMNAFVEVWTKRLETLGQVAEDRISRHRVAEEGAEIAHVLLTKAIRALDYAPPVDVTFGDFLSALLTADRELVPNDNKYHFHEVLRESFQGYGIKPASNIEGGYWELPKKPLSYDRVHFEPMQHDIEEVSRFIWENFDELGLSSDAFMRVISLRPCVRIGEDGFALRETVAEYAQTLLIRAHELRKYKIRQPKGMPDSFPLKLYGGGSLIFDEFGQLKFHARNRITNFKRQSDRLAYLWATGMLSERSVTRRFAASHRGRGLHRPGYEES